MAPDLSPISTKTISVQKRVPFFVTKAAANGIMVNVERIPPLSTSQILQLQIWHGVTDPANGDNFQLYLLSLDSENPPDNGGVRSRNIWSSIQNWQQSAGGFLQQTIEHENMPIIGGAVHNTNLASRTREWFWSFFMVLSFGTFNHAAIGTLFIEHLLMQRRWPNDAYTFNVADSTNLEGITDIDMDTY